MKRCFTSNDLVKLAYNEADYLLTLEMRNAIKEDPVLKSEFDEMVAAQKMIDHDLIKPSNSSVRLILDYARKKHGMAAHC